VSKNPLLTSEWLAQLGEDPIYAALNIRREFAKMSNEYRTQKRNLTRIGFVKWLNNRADRGILELDADDDEPWESPEVMEQICKALENEKKRAD